MTRVAGMSLVRSIKLTREKDIEIYGDGDDNSVHNFLRSEAVI